MHSQGAFLLVHMDGQVARQEEGSFAQVSELSTPGTPISNPCPTQPPPKQAVLQ